MDHESHGQQRARSGLAAGVPYLALPPSGAISRAAPLVVIWHLLDPPRTETAMAAALPLVGVPAWRIYLGLPLNGSRTPAGGFEEIMRLARQDALLSYYGPVVEQAAAELPAALAALREELPLADGPIGLVGGSAGGAAALLTITDGRIPVSVAALINPAVRIRTVIDMDADFLGGPYNWTDEGNTVADRLDFIARAGDIADRAGQPPMLIVSGADDDRRFQDEAVSLSAELGRRYVDRSGVRLVSVPGLAHPLAEEPGVAAAPQIPQAKAVDDLVGDWLAKHL